MKWRKEVLQPEYEYVFTHSKGYQEVMSVEDEVAWLYQHRGWDVHLGWFKEIGLWMMPPTPEEKRLYQKFKSKK